MTQNEFRKANDNYSLLADFSFVKGYRSNTTNKKQNLSHLFLNSKYNLELDNFNKSDLILSIENVTNDTYLKVFDAHITKSVARPKNVDILNNHLRLILNHEKFNFEGGIETNENLQIAKSSDKYQHILPYYNFDTVLDKKFYNGSINLSSSGSNTLKDTNNLETNIINNLNYYSKDFISNLGVKKNFDINIKNLNSVGKNNPNYKSSPQIEIVSLLNAEASWPLLKNIGNYDSYLTPKVSFRLNPNDMKNYASSNNKIDVGNIFSTNRLGLSDTYEAGRSLTFGVDYKKENLNEINKYFEIKLATALRDKKENFISSKSTLNRKTSNLFGSVTSKMSDNLELNYNFAIDNDYNKFEYNDFNATFSVNNIITKFNFIEENGEMGDANAIESKLSYQFDDENFLSLKTRRNRKINLTEYYDLVYEYKNDCLTAGIKYKKTYYQDRDLKPTENLLFTITLFPLTTYEYNASDLMDQ
jgi:LPS-assembly protein